MDQRPKGKTIKLLEGNISLLSLKWGNDLLDTISRAQVTKGKKG